MLKALGEDRQTFEVLPEAWPVVQLFLRVQTQWRTGPGGFVGLDYQAVFSVMERLKIQDDDGELFAGLQIMEAVALNTLADGQ